jgi:MFS family permease
MNITQPIAEGAAATPNRWLIAAAGALVMMTIGTIFSWGIFTQPLLVAFRWDLTVTTWAYAIANFSLAALGTVIGGFWQDKVGPRPVAMVGVTLWGLGNVLAGLGTSASGAPWLYVSYGIIGGIGAGMAYITPLSMVTSGFPTRRDSPAVLLQAPSDLGLSSTTKSFLVSRTSTRPPNMPAASLLREPPPRPTARESILRSSRLRRLRRSLAW